MVTTAPGLGRPPASLSLCPLSCPRDSFPWAAEMSPPSVWPLAAQGTSGDARVPTGKAGASTPPVSGRRDQALQPGFQGSAQLSGSSESWVYGEPEPRGAQERIPGGPGIGKCASEGRIPSAEHSCLAHVFILEP